MAWNHLRDFFAYTLLSLGIIAEPANFYGGMFLAIAGGYLATIWMPEGEKKELQLMLLTAIVVSILIAIIHPNFEWLKDIPLQFCMGISGFLSRYVVVLLLRVLGHTVDKSQHITDKAIENIIGKDKGDGSK